MTVSSPWRPGAKRPSPSRRRTLSHARGAASASRGSSSSVVVPVRRRTSAACGPRRERPTASSMRSPSSSTSGDVSASRASTPPGAGTVAGVDEPDVLAARLARAPGCAPRRGPARSVRWCTRTRSSRAASASSSSGPWSGDASSTTTSSTSSPRSAAEVDLLEVSLLAVDDEDDAEARHGCQATRRLLERLRRHPGPVRPPRQRPRCTRRTRCRRSGRPWPPACAGSRSTRARRPTPCSSPATTPSSRTGARSPP